MIPTISQLSARAQAERLFSRSAALKLLPPPRNETPEDLNAHCRRVLGIERIVRNPEAWRAAA